MLRKITFPRWLDGQTIAVLTLLAALGAMMQTGFADIRNEIGELRNEMRGEIGQLRNEVRTDLRRLDDRLRKVELDVASIKARLGMAADSDDVEVAHRVP